ncbi:hypothetical protein [Ectobacillus ponti]|uniref:Uncharacterized protein n=1 Tax=Ectobacillus ponti TaxID=2961894 RepID=A0AA41XCB6_9BACI|nr:hypothetical protein [Ectobacillus ponti]MCP8970305.1 hypothetical protein [Ectobacillus ponti]
MKAALVYLLHSLIWGSFSLVTHLSQRDKLHAEVALFLLFLYFSYVVAHYLLQRRKPAAVSAIVSSIIFLMLKELLQRL